MATLACWGMVGVVAYALNFGLGEGIPALMSQYQTSMSLAFVSAQRLLACSSWAFCLGGITLVYGLAWNFGARAFGEEQIPGWLGMPGNYYRDAFWIGVGRIGGADWIAAPA